MNRINAVVQAEDDYLWLGTQKGLVQFDGVSFELLSNKAGVALGRSEISCLVRAPARGGPVWFSTLQGETGGFQGKGLEPVSCGEGKLGLVEVTAIRLGRDHALWACGPGGVVRRFISSEVSNAVATAKWAYHGTSLAEDRAGRMWVGTAQQGLFYSSRKEGLKAFPDPSLKQETIGAIAEDSNGWLWVGTENGLRCYDTNFQAVALPVLDCRVRVLLVDRHGMIWVGTSGDGLVRYQNGIFTGLKQAQGLAHNSVTALFEDREGNLWVGTKGGLSELSDIKLPIYSEAEGLPHSAVHGVAMARDGGLWIATAGGISHFDGVGAQNLTGSAGLASLYIKRVFESRSGDLYVLDGQKHLEILSGGRVVNCYTNSGWPVALAEDVQSVIVSVGGNLFRVRPGGLEPYGFAGGGEPEFWWVYNLCVAHDGALWVATANGVFRVENGSFAHWALTDTPSKRHTDWVSEDVDGTIWAGMRTGLARIRAGKAVLLRRDCGLFDDRIYAVVGDDQGWVWFNSSRGIFRVRRRELDAVAEGQASYLTSEAYDDVNAVKTIDSGEVEASGCKTRDGRIWFPSPEGVVMIDPAHLESNRIIPPVLIQKVRINGQEFGKKLIPRLAPGPGQVEFFYAALSYLAPQRIQYRYELSGVDAGWVDAGPRRVASYANLKPGHYLFRVKACNGDGVWNEQGDQVEIVLPPYYYQTGWFRMSVVLGSVVGLLGLYSWRVRRFRFHQRQLEGLNRQLESKVQQRTQKLAQSNLALLKEIETQKRLQEQLEKEIAERKEREVRLEVLHKQLVEASRKAGMAEVAADVLHNVGNVLNSLNISASLMVDRIKGLRIAQVARVSELLEQHRSDLPAFFASQGRGQQLLPYLRGLTEQVEREQAELLEETQSLRRNVDHIKEIVAMQQAYARASGVVEKVRPEELVEDALRLYAGSFQRHGFTVKREFEPVPPLLVDRHKILQILTNLLQNARHACEEKGQGEGEYLITVRLRLEKGERLRIEVADNGVGIPAENLTRIFTHGFTTRKSGHGFGLHSSALAAQEMDGSLTVYSAGAGLGAIFTLELPVRPG